MLAAAAIAVTGLSFAPAQAGVRAAPAVLDQSAPAADIMQVHRKRSRHRHHPYYSYYKPYPRYAYPRYVHPYPYAYHRPHYYRKPGFSIQFSFGSGHHW
jgi:hypothetical protein